MAAAVGAFFGHVFPVWLGFKGGKGVATYIGVLLGLFWPAAVAFCLVWLLVAFTFRISSLSALTASGITDVVPVGKVVRLFAEFAGNGMPADLVKRPLPSSCSCCAKRLVAVASCWRCRAQESSVTPP